MTRYLNPLLAACLTAAVIGSFGFGTPGVSLVFLAPAAVLLVVRAVARRRGRSTPEARWSVGPAAPVPTRGPASPRQVAAALGRVEARELAGSPWFGAGMGLLAVVYVTLGIVYADDNGEVWAEAAGLAPWFAHPLAGMTIVAAHRAVTRPRRDGTEELFDTCPAAPGTRIVAALRSAVTPVVGMVAFLVAYGATIVVRSPNLHGPVGVDQLGLLLASLVLVAGAVGLGVALGAWVGFGLVPVVAVVAIGLVSLGIVTAGDPGWNGSSPLSTFGPQLDSPLLRPLLSVWWYLAWMAALTVLVGVVAVLRHRRDRTVLSLAVVLAAVAAGTAAMAVRPVEGAAAATVAHRIAEPGQHQVCEQTGSGPVEVCTYHGYGELHARLVAALAPVSDALPDSVAPIVVQQRYLGRVEELPPAVRSALPDGLPAAGEREVRVGFSAGDGSVLAVRLRVAFLALGLSTEQVDGELPRSLAGEARGVAALWLAARGMDAGAANTLATFKGSGEDAFGRGLAWPDGCGPVVWSPTDLEAARAVLALPEAQVRPVVLGDLARWSSPAVATDELLAALQLPGLGAPEPITLRLERWC